jgi:hypothetical protein
MEKSSQPAKLFSGRCFLPAHDWSGFSTEFDLVTLLDNSQVDKPPEKGYTQPSSQRLGDPLPRRTGGSRLTVSFSDEEETDTMNALQIVQIIFAIATIATGLVSLAVPRSVKGFTGLDVSNARGITEIRAILGGAFIGLGAAPLIFHILEGYTFAHVAYQTLGITYLTIFVARIIGMVLDKSWVRSNYISLATEIVLGIVLVL